MVVRRSVKVVEEETDCPVWNELPSPPWHHMSRKERQAKGYYPNMIAISDREVAITCKQSEPDWPLNKAALDKAVSLFGVTACVRLVDVDGKLVAQAFASEVANNLRNTKPAKGIHGDYYWIGIDFNPSNGFGGLM